MDKVPENFANHFVRKDIRERVIHEWKKKPEKLHARICHSANDMFDDRYKNQIASFESNEKCFILNGRNIELSTFQEAESYLGIGSGVLIVSENGNKFIAETESSKGVPYETYAGH